LTANGLGFNSITGNIHGFGLSGSSPLARRNTLRSKLLRAVTIGAAFLIPVTGMTFAGIQTAGATSAKFTVTGSADVVTTLTITSPTTTNNKVTLTSSTGNFKTTTATGGKVHLKGKSTAGNLIINMLESIISGKSNTSTHKAISWISKGLSILLSTTLAGTTYDGCKITLTQTISFKTVTTHIKITPAASLTPTKDSVSTCTHSAATTMIQGAITAKDPISTVLAATV
jgi:hypothetical protein